MNPMAEHLDDGDDMTGMVEDAAGRLREARALLDAIDRGGMLAEMPANPEAWRSHQAAVSMLMVLSREIEAVIAQLEAAGQTHEVLSRAVRAAASSKP